ncbi:hypothetical protein ABKV19_011654 [Rosa sericea]
MSSGFDILKGAPKKLLINHSLFHKVSTFCMQFWTHSQSFPVSRSKRNCSGVKCFGYYFRPQFSYSLCFRVLGIS